VLKNIGIERAEPVINHIRRVKHKNLQMTFDFKESVKQALKHNHKNKVA